MTTTDDTAQSGAVAQADTADCADSAEAERQPNKQPDGVAEAAARDVAMLMDRRGLREVVALARRVLGESAAVTTPDGGPRPGGTPSTICTLRQHERPTRRSAASRAVDDDHP
jgi:hypothetical protein